MPTTPQETILDQVFADTTVKLPSVEDYLLGLPRYREYGVAMGVDARARLLLSRTDYVEFNLRHYISGRSKTLHSLNREVQSFLSLDDSAARTMIAFSLQAVEQTILINEWYELMPRYLTARRRIQKRFGLLIEPDNNYLSNLTLHPGFL